MPDSIMHSTLCNQSHKFWSIEKIPPNVDDLLAGADTEEEAKAIIAEIQNLMKSGGFSLRKCRWTIDILHHLQARRKWHQHRPPLSVGDLVLIQADNMPPLSWPLARILEIIPGTDGIPRVALLRTSSGPAKRAINRLIALPVPTCRSPKDGDSLERQQMAQ
ncbi:hypothetical protein HNY73_005984 [Argiope bruennichi]|uniref:DUF5641 domain-containing protein n=1 Tax=Argiope bruennichi TaxID=94029 RepID=A0A8T0FL02_ARGBR|nr:hypothetical protein HNY73_005984 [Argiope bruennichi]